MGAQWWKNVPEEVRKIREQVLELEITPVDSYAQIHFERHGPEFEKQAIRDCIQKDRNRRSRKHKCSHC